ncbi:EAL domain-containing response regulator [Pleionea sediminis]|uniref:EAL domain-containing response regulator n=1 Tax=Pleionea sediminis TaxID=2569479 RepID=UPI0013DE1AE5|nr:EAL domain-containing response regulator [Pleionea sediminis]
MCIAAVIDDNDLVGDLIVQFCKEIGINCQYFDSWFEYSKNKTKEFDLIFLDINMPGEDGLEVIKKLVERTYKGHIVFVSGLDNSVIESSCSLAKKNGLTIDGYLSKPFSFDTFKSMVNPIISAKKSDKEAKSLNSKPIGTWVTKSEIQRALSEKQFFPVFQPQISSLSMSMTSVECLARWKHPQRGVVNPVEFIHKIEEYQLMSKFTRLFLETSANYCQQLQTFGLEINMSFNISAEDINLSFVDFVSELFQRYKIPSKRVTLEVTESSAISPTSDAIAALVKLRLKGFGLSIDDFGTGYSTIGSIQELPFNEIKVDRSFTSQIDQKESSLAIVKSIIALSQELDYSIVVEGIENPEQLKRVLDLGDALLQGFFFSKPLEFNELLEYAGQDLTPVFHQMGVMRFEKKPGNELPPLHIIESNDHSVNVLFKSISEYFNKVLWYQDVSDLPSIHEDEEVLLFYVRDFYEKNLNKEILSGFFSVSLIRNQEVNKLIDLFELGVDEIVISQMSAYGIILKIKQAISHIQRDLQNEDAIKQSQSVAFEAMMEASEYGQIVQMAKSLLSLSSAKDICEYLRDFFSQAGLTCAIRLFEPRSGQVYGLENETELVAQLFTALEDKGRLFNFNQRLICNGRNCAILIKNLPDDEIKSGRIRDMVAVVIEVLESKWQDILSDFLLLEIDEQISTLATTFSNSIEQLARDTRSMKEKLAETIYASFHVLDLSEEQESYLVEKVDEMVKEMTIIEKLKSMEKMTQRLKLIMQEKESIR